MRQIVVELSAESCNRAVKELEKYQKEVKPKLEEVCRRLAQIGVEAARAHLVLADGNTDAVIEEPVQIDNGYKIVMSGEDVYFVEFGTGNFAYRHGNEVSVPVYPGSYSEQHAQQFSKYHFWWYGGQQYEGTPAYRPLLYAGQAIRQAMPRIVKEVFGQ